MINSVVLVGRLTKDPELKYTQGGVAVTRFTLAANRPFKTNGEQEADFINCVAWRKTAENTANFLRKGSLAGITGRIQTSNFEGKDGNRVFMTEVVADSVQFLEPKNNNLNNTPSNHSQGNQQPEDTYTQKQQQSTYNQSQGSYNVTQNNNNPYNNQDGPIEVSDDDLPF